MRGTPDLLMALADDVPRFIDPGGEAMCARFRLEIASAGARTSDGVLRMIPDGCEFTIHRELLEDGVQVRYLAVYAGPARDRDEALAGMPPHDPAAAAEKVSRMRMAGLPGAVRGSGAA